MFNLYMLLADIIYHSFIYLCVNELFLFSYWLYLSFRHVEVIWLIIKLATPTMVYHWWCDKVGIFITLKFIICNPLQLLQIERNFKPLNLSHKMFLKDIQRNKELVTFKFPSTLDRSWALNFHVCLSTLGILSSLCALPTCCAVPGSWFGELILALNVSLFSLHGSK